MKFLPTSIHYEVHGNADLVVHMHGRNDDGSRGDYELRGVEPYFYTTDWPSDHPDVVRVDANDARAITGESVNKVVTRFPFHVPDVREECRETWEADVWFSNRIRYDLGIKNVIEVPDGKKHLRPEDIVPLDEPRSITPRVCVFDIETSDKNGYADARHPTSPVLSITLWDSFRDRYVLLYNGRIKESGQRKAMAFFREKGWNVQIFELPDEAELFRQFRRFLHQVGPDIIVGWNSSKMAGKYSSNGAYDVPYLTTRAENMRYLAPNWKHFAEFDLMDAYAYYVRQSEGELESKALDWVSQHIGLEGKVGRDVEAGESVWRLYENDPGSLCIYNVNDVYLTKEIMLRTGCLDFFLEMVETAGTSIGDCLSAMRIVDAFTFHQLAGEGIVQPTKRMVPEMQITGGHVEDPAKGLYHNVVEVDLSAQYPSVMRTFNISPDTKVGSDYDGPTFDLPNASYRKHPRGIIPRILDNLIEMRYRKRDAGDAVGEKVVKAIMNAFYGSLSSKYYRNADADIGNDITGVTRQQIQWMRERLESGGNRTIYSDTDSWYCILSGALDYDDAVEKAKDVVDGINESFRDFARQFGWSDGEDIHLHVDLEEVYEAYLQAGSKKRYACIYRDPQGEIEHGDYLYTMKTRGFETRRSDSALVTRRLQDELFQRILFGASRENVREWLHGIVKEMKAGKMSAGDIRIPTGINKRFRDYKTTPDYVRAAKWSNDYLGKTFGIGDKPCMFFGHIEGLPRTDIFALEWRDELPEKAVIDWDRTIERTVTGPLESILDLIDIRPRDVTHPTHEVGGFL